MNIKKEKMTQRNRRGAISKREERVERERERERERRESDTDNDK